MKAFADLRLGLFVHYCVFFDTYRVRVSASLDELADGLDVEDLAEQATSMQAEYVVFTAWHANMNALYPSAVIDAERPGHSARRDVIRDLLKALKSRDIALMLYVHPSDGHDFPPADQELLGWNDGPPYAGWNDFVNGVFGELAHRYRGELLGYWVDGGLPPQIDATIGRLRQTLREADPQAVVVQNEAFAPNYFRRWADYGCRETFPQETSEEVPPPYLSEAMQVAVPITDSWFANHTCLHWTPELAFQYTVLQAAVSGLEGGGVLFSAGPYPGGEWEPGVRDFFRRLGEYVEPVKEAILGTQPSSAFITDRGTPLIGGPQCVATQSANGTISYIHVLHPPGDRTVRLPVPADGRAVHTAHLLRASSPVGLEQDGAGVTLTLGPSDGWEALDTVIVLE